MRSSASQFAEHRLVVVENDSTDGIAELYLILTLTLAHTPTTHPNPYPYPHQAPRRSCASCARRTTRSSVSRTQRARTLD